MSSTASRSFELKSFRKPFSIRRSVKVIKQWSSLRTISTIAAEYVYEPLKKNHIRVLELLPGEGLGVIRVGISSINLWQARRKHYHALSYTWGSADSPKTIFVEPKTTDRSSILSPGLAFLSVTPNLYEALLHIIKPDVSRILWVDAVCINQKDVVERGAQVQLMASIFSNARITILWLGPAADESERVFDLFRTWTRYASWDYENNSRTIHRNIPQDFSWLRTGRKIELIPPDFNAFLALCQRPWFERLWIRQEVVLSQHRADVLCGSQRMSWENFRTGLSIFSLNVKGTAGVSQLDLIKDTYESSKGDLSYLLSTSRLTKCVDPRDRVYGVLGLINYDSNYYHKVLRPSYEVSVRDLYISACKSIIQKEQSLDILENCDFSTSNFNLPSRVPDWTTLPTADGYLRDQHADLLMRCESCKFDGDVLSLHGVTVDCVDRCETLKLSAVGCTYADLHRFLTRLCACLADIRRDLSQETLIMNLIRIFQNDLSLSDFNIHGNNDEVLMTTLQNTADSVCEFVDCAIGNWPAVLLERLDDFFGYMILSGFNRAVASTTDRRLALVPKTAQSGDVVVILFGSEVPVVSNWLVSHSRRVSIRGSPWLETSETAGHS